MKPKKIGEDWYVVDDGDNKLAGPFHSEEAARNWIRENHPDEYDDIDEEKDGAGSSPPSTRPRPT